MTVHGTVNAFLVVVAAVALVSCTSGSRNLLVGDPMADVKLDHAQRISRTVTASSTGSSVAKQHEAEVVQVYDTVTPALVFQELMTRAARNGWLFDTSLHGLGVGQMATKRIEGATASLTIAEGDTAHQVVLTVTRPPT